MTGLNPTPNSKMSIGGVLGIGDIGIGLVLAIIGFLVDSTPLMWVGVGLFVCGVALTFAMSRTPHRSPRSESHDE